MDTFSVSVVVALAVYTSILMAIALRSSKSQSHENFAIADRNLGVIPVASSLSATYRDGGGIALWLGFGFAIGYGGLWVMFGAFVGLSLFSVFGPGVRKRSRHLQAITVGEMIRSHVGPITEVLTSAIVIVFAVAIIAIQLHVTGNLLSQIMELPSVAVILVCAAMVGAYVALGGFKSVVQTDVVQTAVILCLLFVVVLHRDTFDGFAELESLYTLPLMDRAALFLIGMLYPLVSADAWQKVFAARSDGVVRSGFPLSGIVLVLMTLSLVWIGMSVREVTGAVESFSVYTVFDGNVFPKWFLVLFLLAIVSITMSTVDSLSFLVASTAHRNIASKLFGGAKVDFVRFARIAMLLAISLSCFLAIRMTDVVQFLFEISSLLLILGPVYLIVAFEWCPPLRHLDRLLSLIVVTGSASYIVLLINDSLAATYMLLVPVAITFVLCVGLILFSRHLVSTGKIVSNNADHENVQAN